MAAIQSVGKKVDCNTDAECYVPGVRYNVSKVPSPIPCETLLPVVYLLNF